MQLRQSIVVAGLAAFVALTGCGDKDKKQAAGKTDDKQAVTTDAGEATTAAKTATPEPGVPVVLDMTKPADVLKKMTGITNKMCMCKTLACSNGIDKELSAAIKTLDRAVIKTLDKDMTTLSARYNKCKKQARGHEADTPDTDAPVKMNAFTDHMCVCKDSKCAQDVYKRLTAWTKELFKGKGTRKSSKQDVVKWNIAQRKFNDCFKLAMTAGLPKTDPNVKKADPAKTEPKKPGKIGGIKGGPAEANPANASAKFSARLDQYANEMCACKSPTCSAAVVQKHTKWMTAVAKTMYRGPHAHANARKMAAVSKRISKCMKNAKKG